MHDIYQTKGIILSGKDYGEADRLLRVLTEKFGLISVVAKGVRNLKSKLRYNLSLFSQGEFCLIRIGDYWKLTDVQEFANVNFFDGGGGSSSKISLISKLSFFLIRMLKGEQRNDFIWQKIQSLPPQINSGENLHDVEVHTMAEILHNLGYMAHVPKEKHILINSINKAIKESML